MSTAKINFNTDEHCSYRVRPNLILHFQFIEDSLAHMYFTNDDDYYVNVPENIVVYKYSDIENKIIKGEIEVTFPKRIQLPNISRAMVIYTTTYYTLNTMRKYDICYDNTVVLSIEPQYCWKFVNYKLTDYKKL